MNSNLRPSLYPDSHQKSGLFPAAAPLNRPIRAVTFDAGGTLIEPWPSVGAVYAQVAREFGIQCSPERLTAQFLAAWNSRTAFRYTRDEWAEVVRHSFAGFCEVSTDLFDAIYERFAQPSSWLIYDDVIPTLQKLEAAGLKLAVISNWDDRLTPLLQQLGLATYFDVIVVSGALGTHKPSPAIFTHAAEALALSPHEMLHVGDSAAEDLSGARSAGAEARRIRRSGPETADDLRLLTELPGLLENPINRHATNHPS